MKKKRVAYIDAIKGIACLGVFIHHFIIVVLPATFSGNKADSLIPFDYIVGSRPIGFIFNGNFWVCMFLMISAFLLSSSIMSKNEDRELYVSKVLVRRYPRLMLPVLTVNIICFIIYDVLKLCGFQVSNPLKMSFFSMLKMTIFDMWFFDVADVLGYWMMYILFYGSIIAIFVSTVLNNCKKVSSGRIILICITPFMIYLNTYFLACLIGVWLSYENHHTDFQGLKKLKFYKAILILFAFAGLIWAGYPSTGNTTQGVYVLCNFLPSVLKNASQMYHIFGATLIMIIFICNKKLQNAFDKKIFSFLGQISYAVYLVHPFVNAYIGMPVYNFLKKNIGLALSVLITLVFLIALVIFLSWLFYKFIEKPQQKIVNRLFKNVF